MIINHGITVYHHGEIVHFVGYEDYPPTEHDFIELRKELTDDEELGLTQIAHELELITATPEQIEFYRQAIPDIKKI